LRLVLLNGEEVTGVATTGQQAVTVQVAQTNSSCATCGMFWEREYLPDNGGAALLELFERRSHGCNDMFSDRREDSSGGLRN
jgi:hypothetical protein